ncbi:major facilitator superfamily domain-containing protein 1-like [Coccinella septempunctata]|uniref:major facilitator superfamily domain-containing protein 1-like n=1 Tax=Coccinella septempunctata TaxID=41139 RepID=UPI001D075FB3|nr:major facilitator superfamily domain-containing protein 1-like [Coccinella septempunctata]
MEGDSNREETASNLGSTTSLLHSVTHPSGTIFRTVGLVFLCFVGFGSYFCYDNPAALQDKIERELNISTSEYVWLYSVYSWPNVFLGFIGGFLIDRVFGIRMGTNIYMGLTLLGQLCFSTGVWWNAYWMMLFGRFIFGIGAESLAVAQNNYAVLWFKGKVLNMVFGLQLSFARVGSTVNFMVMEGVYNLVEERFKGLDGLAITFYLATITCVFSFICSLFLGFMDKKAERVLRVNNTVPSDPVRMSDVRFFSGKFWLLNVIIIFFYVAIFPFFTIGKSFFMEKFHMNESDANFICSIVYLISGVVSPLLGFLIDKTGRNLLWIITGISFTIVAHISLTFFTWINPYFGMSIMGISYSILASSLWPLISLVIPEHQLGTAYGVCSALQNSGLAIFTSIVGVIVDQFGYTWSELFFIGSLSVALVAALVLFVWDLCQKDILNMSPNARLRHQQRMMAAQILEREKLNVQSSQGSSYSEHGQPSNFDIRIRYLSRIGAQLPPSYNSVARTLTYLR